MSTEIETKMENHTLTEFYGGDEKGVCLQVTQLQQEGFIQLTMEEAAALHSDLANFIRREARRRQELLKEHIKELKIAERAVFYEVLELPNDMYLGSELAIGLVSKFCPKSRHKEGV
jgi:hypothetical protein